MELKYYRLCSKTSALVSPRFISVEIFGMNEDVYDKSEADRYIGELKECIDEYDKDFWIVQNQNERLLKITRHQKRKRCLAMADMCAERRMYWTYRLQDDGDKGYSKDYKFGKNCFWRKWCERWLALADKYKEGNV